MSAQEKKTVAAKVVKTTPISAKTKASNQKPLASKPVKKAPVTAVVTKPNAKATKPAKASAKLKAVEKLNVAQESPADIPTKTSSKGSPKAAQREPNVAKTVSYSNEKPAVKQKIAAKTPAKANKKKPGSRRIDAQPADFKPYTRKKDEEYMNSVQREHFKQILLDWKLQLMEEVDRTVNHMKDVAANDPDPADRATQEEEFSLELRTRDRERKLIRKIDATIDLIDQDDYGYCESCGIEIGIQRLEARPTATQCIDCKTLDEIKERQIHG